MRYATLPAAVLRRAAPRSIDFFNPVLWWLAIATGVVGVFAALDAMPGPSCLLFGLTVGASTATLVAVLWRREAEDSGLGRWRFLSPAVLYTVGHYAFFVIATVAALLAGTYDRQIVADYYCTGSICQLLGLWMFLTGCHMARGPEGRASNRKAGGDGVLWGLAIAALVFAAFIWLQLILTGAYFSKARSTSFAGWGVSLELRWIFYEVGPCAAILALVVLAQLTWLQSERGRNAGISRLCWLGVACSLVLLIVGSAQVRQGLFMIGIALACLPLIGLRLSRWHGVLIAVAIVTAFAVMILLRSQSHRIATARDADRFWYVWEDAVPRSLAALMSPSEVIESEKERVGNRAKNAPDFLARVMAAHWEGMPLMYGQASRYVIEAHIPRFLWPGKPQVNAAGLDPESRIQRHFFGNVEDTAISALVHLYAEFGLAGVVVGMGVLGWGVTRIFRYLLAPERCERWGPAVYAPFVAIVPMSEGFTAFHVVGILRLCVVVFVMYKCFEVFLGAHFGAARPFAVALPGRPRSWRRT